jgi:replicative DNA helicase
VSLRDEQAERAVLGCVLSGVHVNDTGPLPKAAFTEWRAWVWEAMLHLATLGRQVDLLTVSERLKAVGQLPACGGPAGLMELDGAVPFTPNLPSYVAMLRDCMGRRAIVAAADAAKLRAMDPNLRPARVALEASTAMSGAVQDSNEESPTVDIGELAEQWHDYIARLGEGRVGLDDGVRLLTGIEVLDHHAEGFVSNLNVVGGLASRGKTGLAAEVIWNWLKAGIPGAIVGLEDGTKWLTRRHLARHLNIPVNKVARSRLHDHQMVLLEEWLGRAAEMYQKHLRIHRAGGLHASDLLALCRKWVAGGARWIWIDHGLRVDYSGQPGSRDRYDMLIGRSLDQLANLGDRHGVAIIVNWHLNRQADEEAMPSMKDYKESGYLEAAARQMVAVWEQKTARPGVSLVTCLKNTEGGRDWTIALERDWEHGLVRSTGGYPVDFQSEARAARAKKEAEGKPAVKAIDLFGSGKRHG